ncbi:MAG: hypothetical protein [Diaphorina citri cimodo-like virus]|nr:MAG: hypothetical protein [Diaphorina citri cimodo-like virus]
MTSSSSASETPVIPYSVIGPSFASKRNNSLTALVAEINYTLIPYGQKIAVYFYDNGEYNSFIDTVDATIDPRSYRSYFKLSLYNLKCVEPIREVFFYTAFVQHFNDRIPHPTQDVLITESTSHKELFSTSCQGIVEAIRRGSLTGDYLLREGYSECHVQTAFDTVASYHIPPSYCSFYIDLSTSIFGIRPIKAHYSSKTILEKTIIHSIDLSHRWGRNAYYKLLARWSVMCPTLPDRNNPQPTIREFSVISDALELLNTPYIK